MIHKTPVNTEEELVAQIILKFNHIDERLQIFQKIQHSSANSYHLCIENEISSNFYKV